MKSKQFGLTEYNDVILSLYDANPIASVGDSVKKAPESQNKSEKPKGPIPRKVGSKSLVKETYKMRLAAVANLKLRKRMFEYEKQRFKQLTVDFGKLSNSSDEDVSLKAKKIDVEKDKKGGFGLGKFLKKLFRNLIRRFKTKFKRKLGYKNRRRWKNFKRRLNVETRKFWRDVTKPFRQTVRVAKNLPGRVVRGIADQFSSAGRARSTARATRSYDKFIKGTANGGDKLRLARQGLITPSQALSKGGASALEVPKTPNIFRDSFDQLGKPLKGMSDGLSRGATVLGNQYAKGKASAVNKLSQGASFLGGQFRRFTSFTQKVGDDALRGTNRWMDDAVKFGKSALATATKWGKVLSDPQTYIKIKNQFVAGVDKLKGAAQKLYDDFITRVAQHPMFKKIVKSKIGKKVFGKLGKKALGKLLGKLILGVGTALAIWEAIEDFAQGDYEGAALAALSAIPVVGIIPAVIDILKDLFPESWESIVSDLTGKNQEDRNVNIKDFYDKTFTRMEGAGANDIMIDGAAADGMFVEAKPQLVLVGEGGEEEFIVPKSKLNYFLGSDSALEALNAGASAVFSSASEYLKGTGLLGQAKSYIPELSFGKELEPTVVSKFKGKQHKSTTIGSKIKDQILDTFKKIFDKIKSLIPPIPDGLRDLGGGLRDLGGGLLRMMQIGGATNGKFGQISSGYGDKDGQDTGVDIELYGSEGKIGKKYGYQSEQGPYGGRGVEISFPYELTYNEFVPGGRNAGARSITSKGSTNREVKGQGVGGFGYVGSYTFTDENGKRYEIMMGHGNQPFNQFKEGQKLPPGTVLGYQGATGSSDDRAGGLYDHISFHVNSIDGGDASRVIRQFANTLISGKGKKATEEMRASQTETPIKATPLNKDKPGVEPTPEADPRNLLQLLTPVTQSMSPQIIPVPMPQSMSSSNSGITPQYQSWGLGITGN
jgi:hypothetical protein